MKHHDKYQSYQPSKEGIMISAGTKYEETRCRNEQIKHIGKLKSKDWSFDKGWKRLDKKVIFQGKQW